MVEAADAAYRDRGFQWSHKASAQKIVPRCEQITFQGPRSVYGDRAEDSHSEFRHPPKTARVLDVMRQSERFECHLASNRTALPCG